MPIFDQGYQHWQGPLSRHGWRWLTIARHGVRVHMKNRLLRVLLLLAWLPALGLILVMVLWGLVEQKNPTLVGLVRGILPGLADEPRAFRSTVWTLIYSFFFKTEMFFIMLLAVIAGPGLISQDLRFNALPLYFARPLTRLDYFLGKLGVIGALAASVAVGPAVAAYVVGVCFCLDLSVVRDTYLVLLGSVAYGLVITLSVGTLMLALSSLTRRSLYVGITWAGLWIISSSVGGILSAVHAESMHREIASEEMNRWLEENPPPKGAQMTSGPLPYPSPVVQWQPGETNPPKKYRLAGLRPDQQEEGHRWYVAYQEAQNRAWMEGRTNGGGAGRRDWRPLCSYVANLERIADWLLDTDAAWVQVGQSMERQRQQAFERGFGPPNRQAQRAELEARLAREHGGKRASRIESPPSNERQLADQMVPQYPWWWSASVLAALMGLSTWILTRRVKSLDRLR